MGSKSRVNCSSPWACLCISILLATACDPYRPADRMGVGLDDDGANVLYHVCPSVEDAARQLELKIYTERGWYSRIDDEASSPEDVVWSTEVSVSDEGLISQSFSSSELSDFQSDMLYVFDVLDPVDSVDTVVGFEPEQLRKGHVITTDGDLVTYDEFAAEARESC